MHRHPHVLKPNKSTFRPRHHVFVDVESHVGLFEDNWRDHTFRLGVALYWRRRTDDRQDRIEWYDIEDIGAFWSWIESLATTKTRLLLISHNLNYDLVMLRIFEFLPKMGWELTKFYAEQSCKIFNFRKGSKTIQCVDNANWFKGALADWASVIGYPKMSVDFEDVTDDRLREYCRRDVEILYRLWLWWYTFLDENNCGAWGITVPSQAFNSFRHRFLTNKVFIHNDVEVLKLEREGYHGGRVECFRTGFFEGGVYYKLDVNSMYPYAMWCFPYPISLMGHAKEMSVRGLKYRLDRYCVMSRVTINTDVPYFPSEVEGRIVYPVGRFVTVLSTPELKVALSNGWIEEVGETTWYLKGMLFRDYVEYWYRLKTEFQQQSDFLRYSLTKLFLNSLYGKFGQQGSEMIEIGTCNPTKFEIIHVYDVTRRQWRTEYYVGGKVFLSWRTGDSYHAFPAIAAHVTAYARMYLYEMVRYVGRDSCFYCDTDSIIVGRDGFERIEPYVQPFKLGYFKVESEAEYLNIYAPKDYVLGEETKIKGVKKNAVWLDDHTLEQEIFPSIKGLMGQPVKGHYRTKRQIKRLKRTVQTGTVDDSGIVHPYHVGGLL